jgi:mannose-6-phosphate isomerase-like protein (cupin superfamily)
MPTVFPPSPEPPGATSFEFAGPGATAPKYTSIQRLHLTGGTSEEPADEARVRFFYVLQGEGALASGDSRASVRPGSALLLRKGETFHLTCVSTPLILLGVAVSEAPCSPPHGR